MINQADRAKNYKVYEIKCSSISDIRQIKQCSNPQEMYNRKGFFRRANITHFEKLPKPGKNQQFNDPQFKINIGQNHRDSFGQKFKLRRLYDVYEKQFDIFKLHEDSKQSFIDYSKSYSTFVNQFALIDKIYLKTLFVTRNINKEGYYEYFVRRNGQYYLEYIDDYIPVQGKKLEPIWGLSYECPWELLLLKAWLKQKRGLGGVLSAAPFQFLHAFGLPGYSAKNIKRELKFIINDNTKEDVKKIKQKKIPLNKPQFNIIAKTRNHERVQELGLVKNCVGYKIVPIVASKSMIKHQEGENAIYKVHSAIPSKWIGSLSVVKSGTIKNYNPQKYNLNLQKQFLVTESQILALFSKYYIAKDYFSQYSQGKVYQDSYQVQKASEGVPNIFKINVNQNGTMNINIELHENNCQKQLVKGKEQSRWPYIKYFLAKLTNKKSSSDVAAKTQKGISGQFQPNLFKYQYYDIEFIKGYHKSCNRFLNIQKGEYYLYVQIDNINRTNKSKGSQFVNYVISVSASAQFDEIKNQKMSPYQLRQLVDATIFHYALIHGQKYGRDGEPIYMGNTFKQIGFGFMALDIVSKRKSKSKDKSKDKTQKQKLGDTENKGPGSYIEFNEVQMGIRVLPNKLKRLKLAAYYYQENDGSKSRLQDQKPPVVMVARYQHPKIIVFEDPTFEYQLKDQFPEPESVEVYRLNPKKR